MVSGMVVLLDDNNPADTAAPVWWANCPGRQAAAVATLMGIVNDNDDRGLRSLRTMGRCLILV